MTHIDGRTLTLETVEAVARGSLVELTLSPEARDRIIAARTTVEEVLSTGRVVYGISTGFGRLADVVIRREDQVELQRNLLRSHAAGTGPLLSREEARAILLLRANALAHGNSGCRVEVVERFLRMLELDITPAIPEAGSVGASGDLAPLAHAGLVVMGEGEVLGYDGEAHPSAPVLQAAGLAPIPLAEKEGLALINGTQATTGLGALALLRAERALDTLEVAGAMSLEALMGTPDAFKEEVHLARPHPGQLRSAALLRELLAGSEIRESHREGDPRVQDAYSLRCMPQIHGAARGALGFVREVLSIEINSATDNPLIFPESGDVISAGNFHAQPIAQALDLLCIAIADLAAVSERRMERLLNPDLSGMPAFLTPKPGLHSGYMILQVTVADLLGEMRVLAHPASVDSVPTSANQEDHISMGMGAARKARRSVDLFERVVAAELLAAAQGLEFRAPLQPGQGVAAAWRAIRERVAPLTDDRPPAPDLREVHRMVADGQLVPSGLLQP